MYDGWLPYPPEPADHGTGQTAIRAAAAEAGRGGTVFTCALFVNVLLTDAADGGRAARDAYAHADYGLPVEGMEQIQACAAGTPDAVADKLGRLVAQGASHPVIRIAALDIASQLAQLDRLAALRPLLGGPAPSGCAGGLAVTLR
jgi:alkanesulfonate monooxygenase SsuD/methylene tetrahydromethanopterin reductase-like flavin-dependent oxidoreductase (luciferase family)